MCSVMASSSILPCLDSSSIFFLLMPWPPDLVFHHLSCCHIGRELTSYALLLLQPSNIYFFPSQITSLPCASLILCFHLLLYTPPLPAAPPVYQKFTLSDSTNPFQHSREGEHSKDVHRCSDPQHSNRHFVQEMMFKLLQQQADNMLPSLSWIRFGNLHVTIAGLKGDEQATATRAINKLYQGWNDYGKC